MTQSPSDRLDRIEAALDRQVSVNGDLRTSVEVLNNTVNSLQASVSDLRFSVDAILGTVQQHQQNFEVIAQELRLQRGDIAQLHSIATYHHCYLRPSGCDFRVFGWTAKWSIKVAVASVHRIAYCGKVTY